MAVSSESQRLIAVNIQCRRKTENYGNTDVDENLMAWVNQTSLRLWRLCLQLSVMKNFSN